jgi:para-nitrobenzyl esterase
LHPVVSTRSGKLEGRLEGGIQVFRGIPYAGATRGALRWQPPVPVEPWPGVRPAQGFGPAAPQSAPMLPFARQIIGARSSEQSQDCLSLNLWTPATDARRRPVLVWIHGGAFVMGAGSTALYDGLRLARGGNVVVVTLNYRLGALGFLDLASLWPGRFAANVGLRDQIAALAWVRDHIEAFGGDPQNVTIFGESAGGMSVATLLGTPAAQGLFRRAIAQSGAADHVSSAARAAEIAAVFVEELGARSPEALRNAPTSEILAAQMRAARRVGLFDGRLPWQPSVDGDLLPLPPREQVAKGIARGVPLLLGTNREEWKLFMLGDRKARRLDEASLRRRLARALPGADAQGRALAERAFAAYRGDAAPRRGASHAESWECFQADRVFHVPAHRLAELQAAHAPTFAYRFDWSPPALRRWVGACHGIEIPFVFGTLRQPPLAPLFALAPGARRLSARMQRAWLAFAKSGDPGHEDLPEWPAYDATRRATLALGTRSELREAPFDAALRFWGDVEGSAR